MHLFKPEKPRSAPLANALSAYTRIQATTGYKEPLPPRPRRLDPEVRLAQYFDAEAAAKINVDAWHATYRGIMPEMVLKLVTARRFEERWEDLLLKNSEEGNLTLIAEDAERGPVGFLRAGPYQGSLPYSHEVMAINVKPGCQRLGVGRRLLRTAFATLFDQGVDRCFLWVLAANQRARFFFKTLGGEQVATGKERLGPSMLPKVAYAWDNLGQALGRQRMAVGADGNLVPIEFLAPDAKEGAWDDIETESGSRILEGVVVE